MTNNNDKQQSKLITRADLLDAINAIHLTASATAASGDFRRGHGLALLAVSEACGVRDGFLAYARRLRRGEVEEIGEG